jgi:hypothetical protein
MLSDPKHATAFEPGQKCPSGFPKSLSSNSLNYAFLDYVSYRRLAFINVLREIVPFFPLGPPEGKRR